MKVDVDGMARRIKAAIGGKNKAELRFCVDEMARAITGAEAAIAAVLAAWDADPASVEQMADAIDLARKTLSPHRPSGAEYEPRPWYV